MARTVQGSVFVSRLEGLSESTSALRLKATASVVTFIANLWWEIVCGQGKHEGHSVLKWTLVTFGGKMIRQCRVFSLLQLKVLQRTQMVIVYGAFGSVHDEYRVGPADSLVMCW